MLGGLNFKHAEKNIRCPYCNKDTISQVMLMGGNEAVCGNCKTTLLSQNYKKQRFISILMIASCGLPLINLYLMPIPILAFHFGGKKLLKVSDDELIIKANLENGA